MTEKPITEKMPKEEKHVPYNVVFAMTALLLAVTLVFAGFVTTRYNMIAESNQEIKQGDILNQILMLYVIQEKTDSDFIQNVHMNSGNLWLQTFDGQDIVVKCFIVGEYDFCCMEGSGTVDVSNQRYTIDIVSNYIGDCTKIMGEATVQLPEKPMNPLPNSTEVSFKD